MEEPKTERERLKTYQSGEVPPTIHSEIVFTSTDIEQCTSKILSIMKIIMATSKQGWPEDTYWRERLPTWFLDTFKVYSQAELSSILADKSQWPQLTWTFGSWIDSMRNRCWEWWSLKKEITVASIFVVTDGDPCSTSNLGHLITAAGGEVSDN